MSSGVRRFRIGVSAGLLALGVAAGPAQAEQAGVTLKGRLVHTETAQPLSGLLVVLEELRRETHSADDGTFEFEAVPPGEYHLAVRAEGFGSRRTEITVGTVPVVLDVPVQPELHYTEVVSAGPSARSAFETYQPTSVLAGQDLDKQLQGSLGATLSSQPGVTERSLGPAPSRPVIRGLDGDRVLILEDGQRTGDLSSQSGDHGVAVNPAAASKIEVVRGPATLLYGANAIGGLVNVITERVPTRAVTGVDGAAIVDVGTAAREAGGAADLKVGNGRWALHASGSARRAGDVETPDGPIDNSQARTAEGSVGVAWTGERAYLGGSYGYDNSRYGVPILEGGGIQLTPERHQFTIRSGGRGFGGLFESYRATLGHRRYEHQELEGTEVGTVFRNRTTELEVLGGHKRVGRFGGTIGAWAHDRRFEAIGAEALSPPVDQQGFAGFLYEEVTWPHVTLQFGGRVDHARFRPEGGLPDRAFTNVSTSAGLLYRPAAAQDAVTIAVSVARAARNPALEELYYFGVHAGNFSFEIGNPDLGSEVGIGVDASLRWQTRRVSGEVTVFRNSIADYIFRKPIAATEFQERFGQEGGEAAGEADAHDEEEFPFIEFSAADSVLTGFEAHTDVRLASRLVADAGVDYVRGELSGTGDPLPRIPPFRARAGLRYQYNALQAGGEITAIADQDRVYGLERRTGGATLLKLFASYSFQAGGAVNTISARLDNATNERYFNHLSLIKDFVPEMGRNFRVIYSVKF